MKRSTMALGILVGSASIASISASVQAQTAVAPSPDTPAATAQSAPASARASSDEDGALDPSNVQTWYVMIALYEPETSYSCGSRASKVSTKTPIAIDGPPRVNINHINEVVAAWKDYVARKSPAAYRMVRGQKTDVYFRRSAREAREAFSRDGHLRRNRRCERSVLITHPVDRFTFRGPRGFTHAEYGFEYVPPPVINGNIRELARIPGVPEGK